MIIKLQGREKLKPWAKLIDSPITKVNIFFHPIEQNHLLITCHEDVLKILRLKKLRIWKKEMKLSKICGYFSKHKSLATISLPSSWKGDKYIKKKIFTFCDILFSGTHKDL